MKTIQQTLIWICAVFALSLTATILINTRQVSAAPQLYISDEVFHDTEDAELLTERLWDDWRSGSECIDCTYTQLNPDPQQVLLSGDLTVELELFDRVPAADQPSNTQPSQAGETSSVMQDGSPKPLFLIDQPYINEQSGSRSSQNMMEFRFSPSLGSFGAWFGDLETRTDGQGTPATVELIAPSGEIIDSLELPTATTDQSLCGSPINENYSGCGNQGTRFIGFHASPGEVWKMQITVGDDDSLEGSDNGNTEHFSVMGFSTILGQQDSPEPNTPSDPAPVTLNDIEATIGVHEISCNDPFECDVVLQAYLKNNSASTLQNLNLRLSLEDAFAYDQSTSITQASTEILEGPEAISAQGDLNGGTISSILGSGSSLAGGQDLLVEIRYTVNSSKGYAAEQIVNTLSLNSSSISADVDQVSYILDTPIITPTPTVTPAPTEEPTATPAPSPTEAPDQDSGGDEEEVLGTESGLVKTGSIALLTVSVGIFIFSATTVFWKREG